MPPVAPRNAPGIPGAPPRSRRVEEPSQGPSADAILDKFIAQYLSSDLVKMEPEDGLTADGAHNWVLAGSLTGTILIDAREGGSFAFAKALPHASYQGMWFNPASGETRDAGTISGMAGAVTTKPDSKEWLLLLTVK